MKKTILSGLAIFLAGAILIFLSGSTSGPELKPTVPFLYGTNQAYYLLVAVAGLAIFVVGIVLGIINAVKKPKA